MRKAVLMGLSILTLCIGCSVQVPDGMHKFKLGNKMDIEGARVWFKLNKSGDSLFVSIHKPWKGDPDKEVKYEINLYDKGQKLIQSRVKESTRKYNNISTNFSMVDKSNIDRVVYFSINISE